jgi:hypothetical protein
MSAAVTGGPSLSAGSSGFFANLVATRSDNELWGARRFGIAKTKRLKHVNVPGNDHLDGGT